MHDETPFGIWLSRGLHKLFDDIAHEPIPEDLLKLIEDDRNR
ncbi:NepR family anti-sigma factor [Neokomagataea anthophila]